MRPNPAGRSEVRSRGRAQAAPLQPEDVLARCMHKQHLGGERMTAGLPGVVDDLVGLHATLPATPYLSLHARLPRFRRAQLERELYEQRTLVRAKCMRGTIFIVPTAAAGTLLAATRRSNEERSRRYLAGRGVDPGACERLAPRVLEVLRGRELSVPEIRAALGGDAAVSPTVLLLCDRGVLVRAGPVRGRRDVASRYALLDEWLPALDLDAVAEEEAIVGIVRAYVAAYGPVGEEDIAWWTGLTKGRVRAALAALGDELTELEIAGFAGGYLVSRTELTAIEEGDSVERRLLSLLPVLDPYLMGYKKRERFLDPRFADHVFDRGGNGTSTIVLNGRVIGVWQAFDEPSGAIGVHLFTPIRGRMLQQLREQARRLGAFLFGDEVELRRYAQMEPVRARPTGSYTPLTGARDPRPL